VIESLVIREPDFVLQQTLSGNNLKTLLRNIQQRTAKAPEADDPQGKKVIVRKIEIEDAQVRATLLNMGGTVNLGDLTIEGSTEQGVTPGEAVGAVLERVTGKVVEMLPAIIDQVARGGGDVLGTAAQQTEDLIEDGKGLLEGGARDATDFARQTTEKVQQRSNDALQDILGN
jgi:hypothetical protein